MKILIVCSGNSGRVAPFISEQVIALQSLGAETDYFLVQQKGIWGYLKERKNLLYKIKTFKPDIIHAHYGLSGLLANLQRRIPVVTTYHGSDINNPRVYPFSRLCMMLSEHNIFVSQKNMDKPGLKSRRSLIPCGVDTGLFAPMEQAEARRLLGLDADKKYVLFAGAFHNKVKNAALAKSAIAMLPGVSLLELKGYSRQQVAWLMNAVDAVLMTSFTEGSPQFVKEAMACNCPVVSVPVGDVPDVLQNIAGCYITTYEPDDVAEKLKQALELSKRTEGRNRIVELGLDSATVANQIIDIYSRLIPQ